MKTSAWLPSLALVATLLAGLAAAQSQPTDWPQFRGPTGQGVSDARLPTTWSASENVVWKAPLPGAGTSSPIVWGDRIFLTCYTGFNEDPSRSSGSMDDLMLHLVCLDRRSGKQLWQSDVAPKLPEQATIREGHGYASGTPAADAERVYVSFGKTGVFAFDHAGKKLWQADIGATLHDWGSSASPVLYDNLVIVNACVESASLIALDKRTGKEVWRAGDIKESWNTPILVELGKGNTELVVAVMGKILGLNPGSGEQLWSCDTDITWYMVPSLVSDGDIVYCIGGKTGGGLAVRAGGSGDVTASRRLWTGKKGSNVTSPIIYKGHLYWMNESSAIAYCAEASTGRLLYEERVPRADQIYPSPVMADGKIYYLSRSGRTFVVAARPQFELLATNELGPRDMFNASPAISGDRLLIRSNRFLYCIGQE